MYHDGLSRFLDGGDGSMNVTRTVLVSAGMMLAFASAAPAADVEGTIKLGGVIVDEKAGDLSVMQETYNIYEGFSATQLMLNGNLNPRTLFTLSLNDINLDNRRSDFELRVPGRFRFFTRYDQHRQVFDPDRVLNSTRKDLRFGAWAAPSAWVKISADYDRQTRDGERLGFPAGTASELGNGYDDVLQTGRIEGEVRKGERVLALAYDFSDYSDRDTGGRDRSGYVVSARLRLPRVISDKITHLLRAAYGAREVTNADTDYTLQNFQYTGVALPVRPVQLKYNFYAGRIKDESTRIQTDNFRNNFDATYFHPWGAVFGGYGYEMNDDDRSLTSYHTYRLGGSVRGPRDLTAKVEYANRSKKDEEKLTLLQDIETTTFTAKFQASPVGGLVLGAGFKDRRRDFTDIGVEAVGQAANVYGRYVYEGWGSVGGEYTFAKDEYDNRVAGFDTESHIVTGRIRCERIENLKFGGGLTYLDVGKDLDIEKSILFVEAAYTVRQNYHVEVKYNIYNYDDYVLLDRYYTANIVWINVAYDFDFQSD
jgi:hypothetical protein